MISVVKYGDSFNPIMNMFRLPFWTNVFDVYKFSNKL